MTIDKEALLARRGPTTSGFAEDTVPIEGGEVHVRGLSRWEFLAIQRAKDPAAAECLGISLALLEPRMDEAEVKRWMKSPYGHEILEIGKVVSRLSKTEEDSAKQAYMEFEEEPGKEFRVLPGAETGQDGGAAANGT